MIVTLALLVLSAGLLNCLWAALFLRLSARIFSVRVSYREALRVVFLTILAGLGIGAGVLSILWIFGLRDGAILFANFAVILGMFLAFHAMMRRRFQSRTGKNIGIFLVSQLLGGAVGFSLAIVLRLFVIEAFKVPSRGMSPAFQPGDHLFVVKYDRKFVRGDVVVFHPPEDGKFIYLSRIVGLPGEKLEIRGGEVRVDGRKLDEGAYLKPDITTAPDLVSQLGPDEFFLMSDNRPNAIDSRNFGAVKRSSILGKYWVTWLKSQERPPAIESFYTDLLPQKCEPLKVNEDEKVIASLGLAEERCLGVGGYALLVHTADERQDVEVLSPKGERFDLNYSEVIFPGFHDIGQKAEWRAVRKEGEIYPIALIIQVDAYPGGDEKVSYLAVAKITPSEICVTDRIGPGAEANELARRAADSSEKKPCLDGIGSR